MSGIEMYDVKSTESIKSHQKVNSSKFEDYLDKAEMHSSLYF